MRTVKRKVKDLIKRDGANCRKCGETNLDFLTIDHILPKIAGGNNDLVNLQILCERCHFKKDKKIISHKYKHIPLKEKVETFEGTMWHEEHSRK